MSPTLRATPAVTDTFDGPATADGHLANTTCTAVEIINPTREQHIVTLRVVNIADHSFEVTHEALQAAARQFNTVLAQRELTADEINNGLSQYPDFREIWQFSNEMFL